MNVAVASLSELVDEIAAAVLAEGTDPSAFVDARWADIGIGDWVEDLARVGMARLVADRMHKYRTVGRPIERLAQAGRGHPGEYSGVLRAALTLDTIDVPLVDGGRTTLDLASPADIGAWREKLTAQVAGLVRRATALERIETELAKHSVDRARDLPERTYRQLEQFVVAAWAGR